MIQTKFNFIEEFATIRNKCLFCDSKLKFVFTTTLGIAKPSIPNIKAKCKDGKFVFDLKHHTARDIVDAEVIIDVRTNKLTFNPYSKAAAPALESLSPHVELQCYNKKCKMNYYLCSSIFHMTMSDDIFSLDFEIKPFKLDWECFNISKFWVKNDYRNKTTDIYSVINDFNHKPIIMPMIDFQSLANDKIINKILTLVNFS